MRILQICSPFLPTQGGREVLVDTLCRELAVRGHELVVATETQVDSELDLPYEVWRIDESNRQQCLDRIGRFQPEVVNLHTFDSSLLLSQIRGDFKTVFTFHNAHISINNPVSRFMVRWVDKNVDTIVAVSDFVHSTIIASDDFPSVQVERRWNGVMAPAEPNEIGTDLVFTGRLSSEKGVGVLLLAFEQVLSKHPKTALKIIGDGPYRQALESIAKRLGVFESTQFLGWMNQSELSKELFTARAMIVPSVWQEPFGLVAVEAMMHGVPVIASDVGGLREIVVDQESGYLVAPGDHFKMAERISTLLSDRPLAKKMGQKGLERANLLFSASRMAEDYEEIYMNVVTNEE